MKATVHIKHPQGTQILPQRVYWSHLLTTFAFNNSSIKYGSTRNFLICMGLKVEMPPFIEMVACAFFLIQRYWSNSHGYAGELNSNNNWTRRHLILSSLVSHQRNIPKYRVKNQHDCILPPHRTSALSLSSVSSYILEVA